jgi:hypothetical protein
MSDVAIPSAPAPARKRQRATDYKPPEPTRIPPLFAWPWSPATFFSWFFGFPGYLWPFNTAYFAIALATWTWLTPSLDTMKTFAPGWVALILLRNAALITLAVGAWHARLYAQKAQDTQDKYNGRWLARDSKNFLFNDQLLDNVFWTFASAVPVWTAFEGGNALGAGERLSPADGKEANRRGCRARRAGEPGDGRPGAEWPRQRQRRQGAPGRRAGDPAWA